MYLSTLTFTMAALPMILILFYCIPARGKNIFLLCVGILLYSWGSPMRLLFPAVYLFFDYGIGMLLQKLEKRVILCRCILAASAVLQTTLLFAVRQMPDSGNSLFFPIGAAFFTLQGLGYLIGVYRKKHRAELHLLNLALYLTFFPTIYAGPLISYPEFKEHLKKRKSNIFSLGAGLGLFIRGLAEKVVLADTLGYVFRELRLSEASEISMLTAWLTVATFSMYLYFELLGYSDMARGLASCFGMNLPKNFGQPFFSSSVTAFMESWNITHIFWFQTNFRHMIFQHTKHRWVKHVSLVLMWMLIGFWYGTSLQFLLWGLAIGLLLAMEQLFLGSFLKRNYAIGLLYTAISLQFVWVFFFTDNLMETLQYWRAMLGFGSGLIDSYGVYYFTAYIVFLLICFYIATDLFRNISERISVTAVGQKIASFMPLIDCIILVFCLACMLYTRTPAELWLLL